MCSLHNTFSWQDYIGGYCTGYFWKLSGKSFSNVFLSLVATFVLSQHYRFQEYPLLLCIVVQYVVLVALVMLVTWLSGRFHPLHEDAYKDMFWSFTVPYLIGVVVYYISLFHDVKRANQSLKKIKESGGHK